MWEPREEYGLGWFTLSLLEQIEMGVNDRGKGKRNACNESRTMKTILPLLRHPYLYTGVIAPLLRQLPNLLPFYSHRI